LWTVTRFNISYLLSEVVPVFVEFEVAVPT
jgi:hypothetical protein